MIVPSIATVPAALVAGLDGQLLPRTGWMLRASDRLVDLTAIPDTELPYMRVDPGSFQSVEWADWRERVTMTVPALAKIRMDRVATGNARLWEFATDLYTAVKRIQGLYVTGDGEVVPYGDRQRDLASKGLLCALADRGGPFLSSGTLQVDPQAPFGVLQASFRLEFWQSIDERPSGRATVVAIGATVLDPARLTQPAHFDGRAAPNTSERWGAGVLDTPDPFPGAPRFGPPFGRPLATLDGPGAESRVVRVNVTPYGATLAPAATQQLNAVAFHLDGSTVPATAASAWGTSNAAVCTVAAGLVTATGAGTATVTATYHGVQSNPVTITVA